MDVSRVINDNGDVTAWKPWKDGAEVQLKFMPRLKLEEISNRCQKVTWNRHQRTEELDTTKFIGELCAFIVDWRGIDDGGEPYHCNDENKAALMLKYYGFVDFVVDGITEIETLIETRKEEEKKT